MASFRSKIFHSPTSGGYIDLSLENTMYVTQQEEYKTTPLFSIDGALYRIDQIPLPHTVDIEVQDFAFGVNLYNGRAALYVFDDESSSSFLINEENTVNFSWNIYDSGYESTVPYPNQSAVISGINNADTGVLQFATNIPVFDSRADAQAYLYASTQEAALLALNSAANYQDNQFEPEVTKYWTYASKHGTVELTRGEVNVTGNLGYRTLKFSANTDPAFYLNGDDFSMTLIAPDVVASASVAGPESVLDNIPQGAWTEGSLSYSGPFYTTVNVYEQLTKSVPDDGTYSYATEFYTNIPIFGSEEDALEAIATGDYSKALNYGGTGIHEYDPRIGEEEVRTEFGGGGFMSPFYTILSGGKSQLHALAEVLFTDDGNLWDDIKHGLELYGSNPIDYVIDVKAFPFDVSQVVTESTRYDVWFGSYQHHFDTAFNEVINMSAKYINAGTFFFAPIQRSFLDFEPFTQMSAYFPYHGWEKLDIPKYYQRTVEFRYYVDILTGQALIVSLADGILTDVFGPCEIGTEMPLTGTNFSQWAQGQVRLLTQVGQSVGGGIVGGISSGSVAGAAQSALNAGIEGTLGMMEAKQQGGPRNTMTTKGNFSSNLGNYMPGHIIIRFDFNEMMEPDLLQQLMGRPSLDSGVIRKFSGFLAGKVSKLDMTGMTEEEAERIKGLIQSGIYV